jgi:uncharacterized RDD family membrane protein YckC
MDRYQTFWPRFWAGFIDSLVFIPVMIADGFLSAPQRPAAIIIVWGAIGYTSYWLYSVLLHSRYGQTLGKMAMHVKVLDVSENGIPSFRQAIFRDAGYIILNSFSLVYLFYLVLTGRYSGEDAQVATVPGQILTWAGVGWSLLEIITMWTNKKRRALHDFLAGTVVIRNA